jgi:hypothetical protein
MYLVCHATVATIVLMIPGISFSPQVISMLSVFKISHLFFAIHSLIVLRLSFANETLSHERTASLAIIIDD